MVGGGGEGRGEGSGSGLDELHVIGREHSKVSVWTVAPPPAFVYHLDPGDDVIGVEGDLCVVSWRKGAAAHEPTCSDPYVNEIGKLLTTYTWQFLQTRFFILYLPAADTRLQS